MHNDIDASEPLHYCACNGGTAFGGGDIRRHKEAIARKFVRLLARRGEHRGACFSQSRDYRGSDALGAAGDQPSLSRKFRSFACRCHDGTPRLWLS
jgi:hypothetical protein